MSLANKKPVIEKAIKKFGKLITIKRPTLNEFKEPIGDVEVCKVHGFYYRGNNILRVQANVVGEINTSKEEKLMVIMDDNTELLKKGDTFTLNNVKYKLLDLGNSFDLYYDITLERLSQ